MVDLFLDPNHEKGPFASKADPSLSVTFFVRALFLLTKETSLSVSALFYRGLLVSPHHYVDNLGTHTCEGKSPTAVAMQLRLETEHADRGGELGFAFGQRQQPTSPQATTMSELCLVVHESR